MNTELLRRKEEDQLGRVEVFYCTLSFEGKKTNLAADPVKRLDIEKTPKLEPTAVENTTGLRKETSKFVLELGLRKPLKRAAVIV